MPSLKMKDGERGREEDLGQRRRENETKKMKGVTDIVGEWEFNFQLFSVIYNPNKNSIEKKKEKH